MTEDTPAKPGFCMSKGESIGSSLSFDILRFIIRQSAVKKFPLFFSHCEGPAKERSALGGASPAKELHPFRVREIFGNDAIPGRCPRFLVPRNLVFLSHVL